MQAVNSFVQIELPDMKKTEAGLILHDASGLYGPMAKVISIGPKAEAALADMEIIVGSYIIYNAGIVVAMEVKGQTLTFIHSDGIFGKLNQEEIDAPVIPQSKIIVPGVN